MQRRVFLASMVALPALAAVEPVLERRIRFVLTFHNPLAEPLSGQLFWSYLPAQLLAQQRLLDVQVSMAHTVREDRLGHRILELAFAPFPALAQQVVTVTAVVQMTAPARGAGVSLAERSAWLGPERYIESDAEPILALAATLKRDDEMATARAIYDWVRTHIAYAGYVAEDRGALDAYTSGRGDCTEYADLVVALARAAGVAARMVGGYVLERDSAPRAADYHNWAELYLDGAWRVVDAQKGAWLEPHTHYVVYRIYRDHAINPLGLAHRYRLQGQLQVRL